MLGRRSKIVIAKFLTGMLNQQDLQDYIEETQDPEVIIFAQRLEGGSQDNIRVSAQSDNADDHTETLENIQMFDYLLEHYAIGLVPEEWYNLAMANIAHHDLIGIVEDDQNASNSDDYCVC
jgi:hypothetical protein